MLVAEFLSNTAYIHAWIFVHVFYYLSSVFVWESVWYSQPQCIDERIFRLEPFNYSFHCSDIGSIMKPLFVQLECGLVQIGMKIMFDYEGWLLEGIACWSNIFFFFFNLKTVSNFKDNFSQNSNGERITTQLKCLL